MGARTTNAPRSPRSRQRRASQVGILVAILGIVASVVVAAVHAQGRADVRANTNDGGAWLVRRSGGIVGHMVRSAAEASGVLSVATPGADFDVEQAGTRVAVNDRGANVISVIDPRTYAVVNRITTPVDSHLALFERGDRTGAVIWTTSPLRVWRIEADDVLQVTTLSERDANVELDGTALVAVTLQGDVWVVDPAAGKVGLVDRSSAQAEWTDAVAVARGAQRLTTVGPDLVVGGGSEGLAVVDQDFNVHPIGGFPANAVLAIPAPAGAPIAAVGEDGTIFTAPIDADTATQQGPAGTAGGTGPTAPVAYGGCVFAAVSTPPTFTRTCNATTDQTVALDGSSGRSLRLRLVNGWVWVNDLDTGALWIATTTGTVDRVDDWGNALGSETDGDDDSDQQGNNTEQRNNPDAQNSAVVRADQIDEDLINERPVARDDAARTRVDTPVVVKVLANDTDPDGDVLLVSNVSDLPAEATVQPTSDRSAVQVIPAAGYTGELSFRYTITDGRGGEASANVTVTVRPNDGTDNRPPVAVTDVAKARAGSTASLNVLNNDSDPDGDSISLQSIRVEGGTVVFDPSGQVTITPDPASTEGTATATYTVVDTFGAATEGAVRVEIRLDGSNSEPDARNDSAVTVVGKPVAMNVLANDTDPDNDPLHVAAAPTVVSPPGANIADLVVSLSEDGEFFFAPDTAGVYIFRYTVMDGSESDIATIRVDVEAPADNRPPIAVRDDVTVSRGGSRLVYVLQNDSDPDGDVVALVGWTPVHGLQVEEHLGLGLRITAANDAPSQITLQYTISDGKSDPVPGSVVVAVSDLASLDQPPVARPDIVEVRPGHTTAVTVLVNDYDPEGAPIKVASVSAAAAATTRVGPAATDILITVAPDATAGFSFGYDIVDPAGNRSASFVQVRLVPEGQPNRPPIPRADIARTRTGLTVTIPVLANDTDPDGDAVRVESIAAQPAFGVATLNPDGTISYHAPTDYTGTDHLRYVLVDANGDRAIGDVLIGIMPNGETNVAPSAMDDTFTVLAGSDPLLLDVLANDYDGDGDTLVVTRAAGNLPVGVDPDGRGVLFEPPATVPAEGQKVTVTYSISDGRGGTDDAVVTIDVVAALTPQAPAAVDDVVGPVHPGAAVPADLLGNDLDPDGNRAALVPSSTDPAIVFAADKSATVTAGATTSEHTYTVTDPTGLSADARVTVIVADNLAPAPAPIRVDTKLGVPVQIDIGGQVSDPDGDPLFFTCCDNARHGTAITDTSAAGVLTVTFSPDADFVGETGFAYTADDQHGHVVSAPVIVTVISDNRPPTATDASGAVEAGTSGSVSLAGFVDDPDLAAGDQLTITLLDAPGNVRLAGDQVLVDAPIEAGGSTVSVRYRVTDRAGAAAEAGLAVTITPSSAPPPTAVADTSRTTQDVAVSANVVANDIDQLQRGLTVTQAGVSSGSGSVAVGADGTLTFTPGAEFFGSAQVAYTVQDARRNADGQAIGQWTIEVIGVPGVSPTPQATAANATATVTWSLPAANGAPIDDVQIDVNGGEPISVGVTSSHTFTALTNGLEHSFRVRSHNEAGWGPWSPASAPVIPDTEPDRPAAPVVTFGDGMLYVNWTAPNNAGSAITGYELTIGGGASGTVSLGAITSYEWQGLTNGVSYQFTVVAKNRAGNSPPSSPSNVEHPLRQPDAPGVPQVKPGDRYLDLTWAPAAQNGDPIIEYQVERMAAQGAGVPSSGTSMRWSDLPNGQEQQFRVRARNRDPDWGDWSAWSAPVKPCGVPTAPAAPGATRGDQQAVVTFAAPADNGCAIDAYKVRTTGGSEQSAGGSPHTFTGLSNGTAYAFQVQAHNAMGWGEWSPASASVTPAGNPVGPSSITARPVRPGTVALSWPAANANGAALTGYNISVNNGAARNVGVTTSYDYAGLANSTTYSFRVQACNDVGCGPWSPADSATTWGEPNQPAPPSLSSSSGTLNASWNAPAANGTPITGYNVERDPGGVRTTSGTSMTWTGLNNGSTQRVRVQACNAVGCSPWSGWATETLPSPVNVSISKGGSAVGQPGCTHPSCAWVVVNATGLAPNTTYTVTCVGDGSPFSPTPTTSDGQGRIQGNRACYWGYPNTPIYVTVGQHRSNTINW